MSGKLTALAVIAGLGLALGAAQGGVAQGIK